MGWWDKLMVKANTGVNLLNQAVYSFMGNGMVVWNRKDSRTYVEKGYCDNEIVFACVRVYLNKIKVAPFILSKVVSEKNLIAYDQYSRKNNDFLNIKAKTFKTKALEELDRHPVIDLLNNPNTYQTRNEFVEAAMGYYKLLGETFIYGIGPGDDSPNFGKFNELHVLPAHLVEPMFSGNIKNPIKAYKLAIGDQTVEIPAEFIMHMKTWNPNWDLNGVQLRGLSPLSAANTTLTRNGYNQTAQTKAFKNGGSAYLLSSATDSRPLSPDQIDLLNERIREKIQGEENFHSITATSGLVTATKIGESPADLMLIEADKRDTKKIASVFGIDTILIGDADNSSYNNMEQAYKALVTNVIIPDQIEFRDKLAEFILPAFKDEILHLEIDSSVYPELQPDLKLMMEVYGKPLLTENERRGVFNWDSIDDENMDKIYIATGLQPLDNLNIPAGDFDKAIKDYTGNDYE